jgi:hypothetical protein
MSFLRDTRGVSAIEFAVIGSVMVALILPIADIGRAAVTYISTYQSLRDAAAYAFVNAPPDLTADLTAYYQSQVATWPSGISVYACANDTACPGNQASPTSLVFRKTFTLTPIVWTNAPCSSGCTVTYLQPLQ